MNKNMGVKILTIDDDSVVRESIATFLEDSGFTVFQASTEKEGVEKFMMVEPHLVFVDLKMPEMGGIEVIKILKKHNEDIPLVVISGVGNLHDAIDSLRKGAWDYLVKPLSDMEMLEHVVKNSLEKAKLKKENKYYKKYLEDEIEKRTFQLNQKTKQLNDLNHSLEKEIAEKKSTQEKISKALKEKEVLLKEVHHRVKNNLQIISSMFKLQIEHIEDESVLEIFRDSQNRVKSMAMIHDKLYGSYDSSKIDFQEYVKSLIKGLFLSHGVSDNRIKLDLRQDFLSIHIDIAIPCGLIINELVTNSLKHAFPNNATGQITVELRINKNNEMDISVFDNGVGMPCGFDLNKKAFFGLQLVSILVKQLDGTFSIQSDAGTMARVNFSVLNQSKDRLS